ncbi:MAG TPA: beta-ketoacyl-ACP synthase III [Gemmatimonadales bacterium]|nr:beta-ketoacyl-ACP synthase III [Gemmatimonadales bacterium]
MQRPLAHIAGLGAFVPAQVVTNRDFEARLETSDQWIVERTGIRERRFAGPDETVATMAQHASMTALQRAGIAAADLDAVIVATATPDHPLPSTACYLQAELGAERAAAFDIAAACSGFIYGLTIGEGLIASGQVRNALIIGGEKLTCITDQEDRSTAILFGDGVGAAVLAAGSPGGRGLLSSFIKSDGRLAELLYIPSGGAADPISERILQERSHYMKMAGREVFKHAVLTMAEACDEAIRRAGIRSDQVDLLVPHQANIRIIDATAKHAGIPPEKVVVTVDRYGNTSAASIPMALAEAEASGRLRPGMVVLLVAFGAGFTWGSAVLRW